MYINNARVGIKILSGSQVKAQDADSFCGVYNTTDIGVYMRDNSILDMENSTLNAAAPIAGDSIEIKSSDKGLYVTNNSTCKIEYAKIEANYPATINKNSYGALSYSSVKPRINAAGYYGVGANFNSIVELFDISVTGTSGPTGATGPLPSNFHNISSINQAMVILTNPSETYQVYTNYGSQNSGIVANDTSKGTGYNNANMQDMVEPG